MRKKFKDKAADVSLTFIHRSKTGTVIYQKDQNYRKDPEIPERTKKSTPYIHLFYLSFIFKLSLICLFWLR